MGGVGEGDVEEVAGHAASLVKAVGLEDREEGGAGLDEGAAGGSVEGEEVDEGVAVEVGSSEASGSWHRSVRRR